MFLLVTIITFLVTVLLNWMFSIIFNNHVFTPNIHSTAILISQTEHKPQYDEKIPKSLYSCLPKQIQKAELRAKTTANQTNYYLIGVYNQSQPLNQEQAPLPNYQESLVSSNDASCEIIIPKDKLGMASMTQYVPKEVAYDLSLQSRRQAIARVGGRKKYQELLLEDEQGSTPGDHTIYFPEDIWALKKLGIKLPTNIKVINNVDELKIK